MKEQDNTYLPRMTGTIEPVAEKPVADEPWMKWIIQGLAIVILAFIGASFVIRSLP
jgi:hypothetical protein